MKHNNDGRVEDALEGLVQKIDRLNKEKGEEIEKTRRALASVGRLTEAVGRLQRQKRRERILARRMAYIHHRLEKAATGSRSDSAELKSMTDAVNRFLGGAKTTGQIIEIVAGSLIVMMETVRNVLKSQTAARGHTSPGEARGVDLGTLLKPINTLLNSLVSKSQTSPAPAESKNTEAADDRQPKADAQQPKAEDPGSVPVVKAVPAAECVPRENI